MVYYLNQQTTTWSPEQMEDLKFKLKKASFITNQQVQ